MIVEVHGAGFRNKGAELMLRTVAIELRERLGDVTLVADPTIGRYEERSAAGLAHLFPFRRAMGQRGFRPLLSLQKMAGPLLAGGLPRRIAELYGCVTLRQIDALLDVAGFAYFDPGAARRVRDFAALAKAYARRGKPVVLLPQALGPFQKRDTRYWFSRVLESTSLVYARDQLSYRHATQLAPTSSNKVLLAPDITLFYPRDAKTTPPRAALGEDCYCCLVPNSRMLRDAGEKWAGRYVDLLSNITTQILGHSFAVRIVIHSTAMGRDRAIGVEIVRRARSEKVSVLESEDPLELKGVIGKSWMLVGSRYHSLVAAFSNAVPSICMGWAHKYDMLYRDFGFEDLVLGADSPDQEVQHKVASLMDRHTNNEHREKLRARLDELRPVNQEMWHRVCKVLVGSQERRMSGGA